MTDAPRVLSIIPYGDSQGCLLWRHWWPAAELNRQGYRVDWCYFKDYRAKVEPRLLDGTYNLVLTPRFTWHEPWMVERWQYTLNKGNLAWSYEADDDLFSESIVDHQVSFALATDMGIDLPLAEYEARARSQMEYERTERIRLVGMVDGVSVSTDPLAAIVRSHTDAPVFVIPNAMDLDWWSTRLTNRERTLQPLTIGWTGGWRNVADVAEFAKAWPIVAERFPNVRFVLHGWAVPAIAQAIPVDRLSYLSWSSVDDYPAALKNIDIGCCSVADTVWNQNKSCIKWYELSMSGAACVASHSLYGREITDGYDGLLATTTEEWVTQLSRLVADATLRRTLTRNAQQTIAEHHNIALSWPQWFEAWTRMLQAHVDRGTQSPARTRAIAVR